MTVNVLHVSYIDLPGRRFNGYDLLEGLDSRGIRGSMAVLEKRSEDPRVLSLYADPSEERLRQALARIEQRHSLDNLLFPWGRVLAQSEAFRRADVIHYQVVQNRMISLLDLPELCRMKPSVWTFHDPWPITGHCVHPEQCEGWRDRCTPCPFLDRLFPLREDRAGQMWEIKRRMFSRMQLDVVVASDFMRKLVHESPLTSHFERVHLIPFGIDSSPFLPDSEKTNSRTALGIPQDHVVLLLRGSSWGLKGVRYALEALASRPPSRPTTIVSVDEKGLLTGLSSSYNVVDLGWVEDEATHARILSACDVFLMPSTGESFGLMALEAMAAGRPVVCFQGTAVESVTHAPDCGIAVPVGDAAAMRSAIDALVSDPDEMRRRSALGRALATSEYSAARYYDSMAELYRGAASRKAQHQE